MAELFSKATLKAYLEAFVEKSASLQYGAFSHKQIGIKVFGKKSSAGAYLTKCYSQARTSRPLKAGNLDAIILACRTLLTEQYRGSGLSQADAEAKVIAFEKQLCKQHSIGTSGRANAEDFRCDRRFEEAIMPVDFGMPGVLEWHDGNFGFTNNLRIAQNHAIETLDEVLPRLEFLTDDERRLQHMHVVVSAAAVNPPGSRFHDQAIELSLHAATHAHLHRMVNSFRTPDSIRSTAIQLTYHLYYNLFNPTLDSATNYLRYALQGERMPDFVWRRIRIFLEQTILETDRLVEMDPSNPLANLFRSSALSMKARLLAVLGEGGALREADQYHRASLPFIERLSEPYGFIYPILRDIVNAKITSAIRRCQEASSYLEQSGSQAATAYAGLMVILTHRRGGTPTVDQHFLNLARHANSSPAIQYKYSHLFDAAALRLALKTVRCHQ